MNELSYFTVNITIIEIDINVYKVKASYTDECNKEYTSIITGEIDPWDDIFIPVYKDLAINTLHKALLTKFNLIVRVKYPDIDDPYDGFFEGETKEYKYVWVSIC